MPLTWIEINQKNILHNIRQFRNLAPDSEFWPVVKSNAYGHGSKEIVSFLKDNEDVAGFMVANLDEALAIKKITKKPIMVLSYFDTDDIESLKKVDSQISLPIYDLATANYLESLGQEFLINIKIDTGTSRLGFKLSEAQQSIAQIEKKSNLKIFSIFTHYAESEVDDQSFTKEQLSSFQNITREYKKYKFHSACSAASITLAESQGDIIRVGLAFYGLWPSQSTKKKAEVQNFSLQAVMTWKTKIIQIKKLKSGDSIGYNRTYKCLKDCQIAVLPIGYNEGYPRLLSNNGEVLIQGRLCPIRGNVCMNLTMVELPDDLEVKVGEIVTLLGFDVDKNVSAEDIASKCQSINYEIVTRINPNLERKLI